MPMPIFFLSEENGHLESSRVGMVGWVGTSEGVSLLKRLRRGVFAKEREPSVYCFFFLLRNDVGR